MHLLTLNLWNVTAPLTTRMERLLRFLRAVKPDLVALQEVSLYRGIAQSVWIAKEADYRYEHYSRCGDWRGREEGLAVLSKHPIRMQSFNRLPDGDAMPRCIQRIRVTAPDNRECMLLNTHLSYPPGAGAFRLRQAVAIGDLIASDPSRYLVLCGDLNDSPDSSPLQQLLADDRFSLRDAWRIAGSVGEPFTFSSDNPWAAADLLPGRRIDYVLTGPGFKIISCRAVLTVADEWGIVSDHYGVLASMEWVR